MKNIILRRTFWEILFLALSAAYLVVGKNDQATTYLVGAVVVSYMNMDR